VGRRLDYHVCHFGLVSHKRLDSLVLFDPKSTNIYLRQYISEFRHCVQFSIISIQNVLMLQTMPREYRSISKPTNLHAWASDRWIEE
jgi:hypothetical protein